MDLSAKSFVINGSAGRASALPSRNTPTYTTAIAPTSHGTPTLRS
ncbi:hypothetical protein PAE60_001110 (plasmid) [Escherichia coli]|nr:hypothetical protein [Escherichia coli]MCQ6587654.1 hypothetical protein [Escherichia coli]WHR92548.1 hypothetical protein PAE60_001110 [Escherichia coli]